MARRTLRKVRRDRDISQIELGQRAGLSQRIIWAIEHGYRLASPDERVAIAEALGLSTTAITWPKDVKEQATA